MSNYRSDETDDDDFFEDMYRKNMKLSEDWRNMEKIFTNENLTQFKLLIGA